jgi:hypothetical protein
MTLFRRGPRSRNGRGLLPPGGRVGAGRPLESDRYVRRALVAKTTAAPGEGTETVRGGSPLRRFRRPGGRLLVTHRDHVERRCRAGDGCHSAYAPRGIGSGGRPTHIWRRAGRSPLCRLRSFADSTGIVQASCRCRIVRRAAASPRVPPERKRRSRRIGRCARCWRRRKAESP